MKMNLASLDALYTGFNTKFQEGFATAPKFWEQFGMPIPSSTKMETYAWLVLLSRMSEWLGPRKVNRVSKKLMQIINRDFEHTVAVDRNDIEDDNLGIYAPLFTMLGADAEGLWNRLCVEALVTNDNWLDGAAFFGTTRKYGKTVISNYVASALSAATFNTAFLTMTSYQGYDGAPLYVRPNLLIHGPKLRTTAWDIVKNQFTYDGTDKVQKMNVNQNTVDLLELPELVGDYDDYWFLAAAKGPVKPIVLQKRKTGALVRWDTDHDQCVKDNNQNEYGTHYRGAAGKTLPHLLDAGLT